MNIGLPRSLRSTHAVAAGLLLWSIATISEPALAAPAVSLSPAAGPPTTTVNVSGTGFSASALVDIYFDTTDLCLTIANGTGNVACSIKIPKDAQPQTHHGDSVGHLINLLGIAGAPHGPGVDHFVDDLKPQAVGVGLLVEPGPDGKERGCGDLVELLPPL